MGTNCASFLSEFFLTSYEANFILNYKTIQSKVTMLNSSINLEIKIKVTTDTVVD